MSIHDEPLPCGGSYDCEDCIHYDGDACTVLMDRELIQ